MSKIVKLIILNTVISCASVIIYSPGFIGLRIGTPLSTAAFVTGILALIGILIYGNASILGLISRGPVKIYRHTDFNDAGDYLETIRNLDHDYVADELKQTTAQIERLKKKMELIDMVLLQFFSKTEMSYLNYKAVMESVAKVFYGNVQNIINRVIIFDPEEYAEQGEKSESSEEHLNVIHEMLNKNAKIIDKMDNLLIEVSRLTDSKTALENLPAIKDLEELIGNTKLYT